jgi:hypothetical protein
MAKTAPKLGGGSLTLDPVAFEARFNMPLVHETVRAELNARRHGPGPGRVLALAAVDRRRDGVRSYTT